MFAANCGCRIGQVECNTIRAATFRFTCPTPLRSATDIADAGDSGTHKHSNRKNMVAKHDFCTRRNYRQQLKYNNVKTLLVAFEFGRITGLYILDLHSAWRKALPDVPDDESHTQVPVQASEASRRTLLFAGLRN